MKTYTGHGGFNNWTVYVETDGHKIPLDLRLDLRNHSPTGFGWGYAGSGPAQLALAVLADALADDARATALYHDFKQAFVTKLDKDESWTISDNLVRALASVLEVERAVSPPPPDWDARSG